MEQEEGFTENQNGLLEPVGFDPHSDIIAANTAMNTVSEIDTALLPDEEKEMIAEIRSMAIRMTYLGLREIYYSNQYESEENP